MVGPQRLWFAGGEYARARQARALVSFLADADAAVLAGDFNTWFGFGDLGYTEIARAFPGSKPRDGRATFRNLLRLDHAFFRLPPGWHADVSRGNERLGSDHYPLISTITLPSGADATRNVKRARSLRTACDAVNRYRQQRTADVAADGGEPRWLAVPARRTD
jgi:hypothetical protein